tara:strand:- start:798 stop:968 length:171 start_codon:yes stop_codon:yes gene_type:complete
MPPKIWSIRDLEYLYVNGESSNMKNNTVSRYIQISGSLKKLYNTSPEVIETATDTA